MATRRSTAKLRTISEVQGWQLIIADTISKNGRTNSSLRHVSQECNQFGHIAQQEGEVVDD